MVGFSTGLGRKSEAVLLALRRELDDGLLVPGSRLPSEKELCQRFDTSRKTVRSATARLAAEGRINIRHGSGAYVCEHRASRPRSRTISVMFPFEGESLLRVQRQVLAMDHLLCVFSRDQSNWDPAVEKKFLEKVCVERHHALLAFCTPLEPRNEELLEQLEKVGVRVVHVEHYRPEPPAQSFVLPDYRHGGQLAASALMAAGYENLLFVGMENDGPYAQLLRRGFGEAIRDRRDGLDPDKTYFDMPQGVDNPDHPDATRKVDQFVQSLRQPTGLLCRSTDHANSFRQAAERVGVAVPDQLGLISVNHLLGSSLEPTTDEITFDWAGLLQRALKEVERSEPRRAQEWVAPTLERRGTVRGNLPKPESSG